MRKITKESVKAFLVGKKFKQGNTEVLVFPDRVEMSLHGNLIARRVPGKPEVFIRDAGWQTKTTKDRLNGILEEIGHAWIYQADFKWWVVSRRRAVLFPSNEWYCVRGGNDEKETKNL